MCAVLQFVVPKVKIDVPSFDLSDGMPHLMPQLIDLRFKDGIFLLVRSAIEAGKLLDCLVAELADVGLVLNADTILIL